jgi:hypothetical protein
LYEWIPDLVRILIRRKHKDLWRAKDYKTAVYARSSEGLA